MNNKTFVLLLVGCLFLLPVASYGQATRTWVSGVGDDANPCSRTAPCKTFAGAISKTATGGEIDGLDPGGFGAVTITKSITIDGSGSGEAGVLVAGANGITISAPGATVILRNLDFEGLSASLNGVSIQAAANVYIENSRFDQFGAGSGQSAGIYAMPSGALNLIVKDTIIRNCVAGSNSGVFADATNGAVAVDADHLSVHNCPAGVTASNGAKVTVHNSDLSGNAVGALTAGAAAGDLISLDNTLVAFNTTAGVSSSVAGGVIRLSNSSILDNLGRGILTANGGTVVSFVTNRIGGNNPDGAPTSSIYQR